MNEIGTVKLRALLDLRPTVWHGHFGQVHDYRLSGNITIRVIILLYVPFADRPIKRNIRLTEIQQEIILLKGGQTFISKPFCLLFFLLQFKKYKYCEQIFRRSGPGSSVGIATDYGLDSPGIESRWERDFSAVQTGPGAHTAESFSEVESGRDVTLTPHALLVPRSKNRVQLYLYSP